MKLNPSQLVEASRVIFETYKLAMIDPEGFREHLKRCRELKRRAEEDPAVKQISSSFEAEITQVSNQKQGRT